MLYLIGDAPDATQASAAGSPPNPWVIQTVGAPEQRWFGEAGARFLAASNDGELHLAYGGDHLYYAHYFADAWHMARVDGADHVGAGASVALDGQGDPWISYCDRANGTVKVARWREIAWEIWPISDGPTADSGGCNHTSITLDAAGMPHVLWTTDNRHTTLPVKYASWDGRRWTIRIIGGGPQADLALDAAGYPHVVYVLTSPRVLFHTWYDGASWQIEMVERLTESESMPAPVLASGPAGQLHLAYSTSYCSPSGACSSAVHHTERIGGQWVATPAIAGVSDPVALAVDAQNRAFISFSRGNALLVTSWTGQQWSQQVIDSLDAAPRTWRSALAFDGAGTPTVGYLVRFRSDALHAYEPLLRRASLHDGIWSAETVDRGMATGALPALALNYADEPRLADRLPDGAVRYAAWANGNWLSETVDARQGDRIGHTRLAIDAAGTPHIGYMATDCAPTIATRTPAGWTARAIPVGMYGATRWADLALALDRQGREHVGLSSSCGAAGANLRTILYARWTGASWMIEVIENLPCLTEGRSAIAIALDADENPYLLYRNDPDLRFAERNEDGWSYAQVAGDLNWVSDAALALGRDGSPHAVYAAEAALRYATRSEGAWQSEGVATGIFSDFALALDSTNAPHLSYFGPGGALAVRHATRNDDVWSSQTIDSFVWDVGGYYGLRDLVPALAIDRLDRPRIAYPDPGIGAARLAQYSPRAAATDCASPAASRSPAQTLRPSGGILTRQIAHCLDDAHAVVGQKTELLNGSHYVRMGGLAGSTVPYVAYHDGLLFRDIPIPQGAQIVSATLRTTLWFRGGVAVAEVAGQLSPQADDFRASHLWPQDRPKTSQRVPWIVGWSSAQQAESPDLAVIVEEIIGQAEWRSGNDLALLISPILTDRQYVDWQAFDFSPANAAQLTISYLLPGEPTPTPTATPTMTRTPTPTPTRTPPWPIASRTPSPQPRRLYLPLLLR